MKPFLLILLLLLPLFAKGQRYHFEKITELQGLSDNRVTSFLKDSEGFIWIGTANGLNRYDGYEFRIYGPGEQRHRLSHEHINHIEQDRHGRLWVATWNGLNVLDPHSDSLHIFLPDQEPLEQKKTNIASNLIWDTYIDKQDRVWLALDARDLSYYDQHTREFHYYPWRDFVTKNLSLPPGHPGAYNAIQRITPKSDHELWLGTTRGLFLFDILRETFTYLGGDTRANATFLSYDSLKKQVCFGQQLVYLYDEATHTFRTMTRSVNPRASTAAALPLIIDMAGLWEVDIRRQIAYPVRIPGLNPWMKRPEITSLAQYDHTDWIGTSEGVFQYNPGLDRFRFITVFPDSTRGVLGYVYHVLDDAATNRYYVSTDARHQLIVIDKKTGKQNVITQIAGKPLRFCSRTYQDRHGRLWVLTERYIFVSDATHERFTVFPHPREDAGYHFNDMTEDAVGNLWFSSLDFGIFHYNTQTQQWTPLRKNALKKKPAELSPQRPMSVLSDTSDRAVWVSDFSYGVFRYNVDQMSFVNYGANADDSTSLQSALANALTLDPSGDVWIATTSGGVSRYSERDKKFRNFSMRTGLPESTVTAIQTDQQGNLWLASQKGITCMNADGEVIKHFGKNDGLPQSGFSTPLSINTKGELLIGAGNGFLKFHPDSLKSETAEFPVQITSAYVSGHSLLDSGAHRYDHDENEFTAHFAALTYLMPQKNTFYYQLEGFDTKWIRVTTKDKPTVDYKSLPHGSYTFRVRAEDYAERPSANIATVSFVIRTPFWIQWWFISLEVLIALLLILWGMLFMQRRIQSEKILTQVATALYNKSTYDEVFWTVAKDCIELLDFEDCVIYLVQEDRGVLVQKAAGGPKSKEPFQILNPIEIPIGEGIVGTVAKTGKAEIVNNTRRDKRYILDDYQRHSEIAVPIIIDDKVFGVIDSEHSRKNFYSRRHLEMLEKIANTCSQKISRYFVEEQIRSKVARDLHDDIGSTLSSISIMSKVALQRRDPDLSRTYLKSIREHTSIMQERLGDMVWAINPRNDTIEQVIARMKEFAAEILEPLDIQYEFTETGNFNLAMDINTRKDFYLIFKEALNNAAKYSGCKRISVHLTHLPDALKLKIEDDGRGFDRTQPANGNGLNNMHQRAKNIRAKLQIESAPGKGSLILLTLPLR